MLYLCSPKRSYTGIYCKYEVHDFVEVLDEFCVRYFVSDADFHRKVADHSATYYLLVGVCWR